VDRVWLAALACVLLGFFVTTRLLDLKFPVPWPDEGSFLFQMLALRDHFTVLTPELHPVRGPMWMPLGFMALEALIFRVVPFSLRSARLLSTLFLCGAAAGVAVSLRHSRARLGQVLILAVFLFAAPIFAFAGNVARMETLVIALAVSGFVLLERGRLAGLGLLLLGPLVHPNGTFAVVLGLAYCLWTPSLRRSPGRADRVVLAGAVLAWAAYGVCVAAHWRGFVTDMGNQLRLKVIVGAQAGGIAERLAEPVVFASLAALVVSFAAARRRGVRVSVMAWLTAAFLAQSVFTAGWLYDIYPAFAALVASMLLVDAAAAWLGGLSSERVQAGALAVVSLGVALGAGRYIVRSPFVVHSLDRATVPRAEFDPPYFIEQDRVTVGRRLVEIAKRRQFVRVQFIPDGEGVLFHDLRSPSLHFVQQTYADRPSEVLVLHQSVWLPPFVRDMEVAKLLIMHPGSQESDGEVVHARDETESWTVYEWPLRPGTR
jgi:hypothetical protein